jgi:hypothetical protein
MASIRGDFFPALSSVAHSDAWKWQAVEDRGQQLGAAAIRASLETYERALDPKCHRARRPRGSHLWPIQRSLLLLIDC